VAEGECELAASPVPQWAQEMSPYHRGPTAAGVLALAVVAVLVALLLQLGPTTDIRETGARWQSPACAEQARLERHGVTSGPSYRRSPGPARPTAASRSPAS
jgi:hypothetical protein